MKELFFLNFLLVQSFFSQFSVSLFISYLHVIIFLFSLWGGGVCVKGVWIKLENYYSNSLLKFSFDPPDMDRYHDDGRRGNRTSLWDTRNYLYTITFANEVNATIHR